MGLPPCVFQLLPGHRLGPGELCRTESVFTMETGSCSFCHKLPTEVALTQRGGRYLKPQDSGSQEPWLCILAHHLPALMRHSLPDQALVSWPVKWVYEPTFYSCALCGIAHGNRYYLRTAGPSSQGRALLSSLLSYESPYSSSEQQTFPRHLPCAQLCGIKGNGRAFVPSEPEGILDLQTRAREFGNMVGVGVYAEKTAWWRWCLGESQQTREAGASHWAPEHAKAERTGTFEDSVVVWWRWQVGCVGEMVEDGAGGRGWPGNVSKGLDLIQRLARAPMGSEQRSNMTDHWHQSGDLGLML